MRSHFIEAILREWKAESGVTHLMLYKVRDGIITVYTDRPGPLVGCRGERIDRYKSKLMAIPYPKITEIRLEETEGIF